MELNRSFGVTIPNRKVKHINEIQNNVSCATFQDQYYYEKFGIIFPTVCPGATETSIDDDYESKVNFGNSESFNFQFQT